MFYEPDDTWELWFLVVAVYVSCLSTSINGSRKSGGLLLLQWSDLWLQTLELFLPMPLRFLSESKGQEGKWREVKRLSTSKNNIIYSWREYCNRYSQ